MARSRVRGRCLDQESGQGRRRRGPGTLLTVGGQAPRAQDLAVERAGELLAAAVSAPALQRRWHAAQGEGASVRDLLGERAIKVSAIEKLAEAQVVWSGLRSLEAAGYGPAIAALGREAWRDRGFGDFWGYMLVAEGAAILEHLA